jgi:hypothetical protein
MGGEEETMLLDGMNDRLNFVSGKRKMQQTATKPSSAVLSHQKLRHPSCCAIGPEMMGPTFRVSEEARCKMNLRASYHQGTEIESEVQCLIFSTVVEEDNIGDDRGLSSI